MEVQDISGPAGTWVSAQTEPGIYTVDLRTLMGWSGNHSFYCSIWVGGGTGKGINLNSVSAGEGIINKTVQFKYDPFGRRIEKSIITNGIPEIISYVYDGANIIQETGAEYVYGPKIDEPISMTRNGEAYYYERDRLGTITALNDSNGNLIEEYHYDPFGRPLNESDIGNRFMFTGREWDSELGLYYYRARYYDPEIGRFINPDLLTWAPNDPRIRRYVRYDPWHMLFVSAGNYSIDNLTEDIILSNLIRDKIIARGALNSSLLNLYTYVNNNPVNWIDPLGLEEFDPAGGVEEGVNQALGATPVDVRDAVDIAGVLTLVQAYAKRFEAAERGDWETVEKLDAYIARLSQAMQSIGEIPKIPGMPKPGEKGNCK